MCILQDYFLDLPEAHYIKTMTKWENFINTASEEHSTAAYTYYKNVLQCIFYKSKLVLLHKQTYVTK